MTFQEVQLLVRRGENEVQEFKRKVAFPEKIVREAVAFANSKGGRLFIGVDNDGSIPGLKFAEEEAYALENALKKYCRPPIPYHTETIAISEKKAILSFHISESTKKPHYVIDDFKTKQGKAYVRVEDRSVQASKEVREILRRNRKEKDIRFQYGEKEQILMRYLDQHAHITLIDFMKIASISRFIASRTLILLVLANVLQIMPREGEDFYLMK